MLIRFYELRLTIMKQPSHEKDKNEDNGVEGALIS